MTAGRPPKFETVEEMQELIDAYLETKGWKTKEVYSKKKDDVVEIDYFEPATITGLAVALGTCRQTLLNYEEKEEFVDTIKAAKAVCENHAEEGAMMNELNATMAIFSLKNNYKWKDKTEIEQTNRTVEEIIAEADAE